MNKKYDINYVRQEFESEKYVLLSKEYKNAHAKLKYKCPKGHEHEISWSKWQQGRRCPYCAGKAKKTIEFIKLIFNNENYTLLSIVYVNKKQKLEYICPNGHRHAISWDGWWKGDRCPYCSGLIRKTIEFVKDSFSKENYKLLTTEYINAHQQLKYICPAGHKCSMTWNNWKKGRRCPKCEDINFSLKFSGKNSWHWKNYSEEELKRLFNYKEHVQQLTNHNYRKYRSIINPSNLHRSRNKYHLDHIFSIINGFENSVPAEIISHPFNLRMLKAIDNLSKNGRSDILLDELYNRYNNWEKSNHEI